MSHTPGPWSINTEIYEDSIRIEAPTRNYVATVYGDSVEPEVAALDNARLIAAAPEMYEALKAAAQIIGHPDDAFSKLMADLIAKVEGR